jgi:hypothetical protein
MRGLRQVGPKGRRAYASEVAEDAECAQRRRGAGVVDAERAERIALGQLVRARDVAMAVQHQVGAAHQLLEQARPEGELAGERQCHQVGEDLGEGLDRRRQHVVV